jgi:hypothetical protein
MIRPTVLFLAATFLGAVAGAAEEPVSFNRDIRPLLAKNCVSCHGGVKHAGEVSFIFRKDMLGKGKSGETVVVPGKPEASELIRRIKSSDPDERMPPPEEHPQALDKNQIALLERWIREGAKWQEHWAYTPPVAAPLPVVQDRAWPKQPLDALVLAGIEAQKLRPAPAAAPHEWLRRVTLDLTGLPPTLAEWDEFNAAAAKDTEGAMAGAVDRLLASPAYGERWAALWLDLARFSDTMGYEKDPARTIWPFRDWVIHAFNADLPFDKFTIKQLAGDLLEDPEPGDLIATAFHRNTQNNDEGGTDDEQFRIEAVKDRVSTTWTAWQGTTFACVQCHAHPYEPIAHDEYYRFMALFDNSEDADLTSDYPRTKVSADPQRQLDAQRLETAVTKLRQAINAEGLAQVRKIDGWQVLKPTTAKSSGPEGVLEIDVDGMVRKAGTHPNEVTYTLSAPAVSFGVLRLETFPEQDKPEEWLGFGAVVSKLDVELVAADGTRKPVAFREVVADFLSGPFDPNDSLRGGAGGFGDYPMTRGPRTGYFIPSEPVVAMPGDVLEIRILQQANCNADFIACHLVKFRFGVAADPRAAAFAASAERRARWAELEKQKKSYDAIPGMTIPVMREREAAARRETRVFARGNRLTREKLVAPGIPELFGGSAAGPPMTRLDMAEWLVGERNPLSARVMANRLWAEMFGVGIVETQEDFGSAGTVPSNQPLLDHLALRLKDTHSWHIKAFLREIALSATYRQTAAGDPKLIERDKANRLLARGPRQRLTAEMVRDQALLVSGMLSSKVSGPPVFPPQPEGIWKSVYNGANWKTSEGEDRYRRGIYTYRKRTSGYPALLVFDAPTGDICTPRRIATNTPLQALNTLNDPAQIEFAQGLAKRMAAAGPELADQLAHGYRLLMLAAPSTEVLGTLERLHADGLAAYQAGEADPALLGASAGQAALVLVANTLLNMDAVMNR